MDFVEHSTTEETIESDTAGSACEEVLLPGTAETNGASSVDDYSVEYLEEEDPMGDIDDDGSIPKSQSNEISDQGDEEGNLNESNLFEEVAEEEDAGEIEADAEECEEDEEEPEEEHLDEEEDPAVEENQIIAKANDKASPDQVDAEETKNEEEKNSDEEQSEKESDDEQKAIKQEHQEEAEPSSSSRARNNSENQVDEEQCRVCTNKEELVSLFKKIDQATAAEMLMTICPSVSIAPKDFMPQYICGTCLDHVTIAVHMKVQCETTERELRKKLSRSKNKVRRPVGYVVIDAPADSEPSEEEEPNDEEFKVSEEGSEDSADSDSEDSDFSGKRRRRGGASRRGRRKSAVTTPTSQKGKKFGSGKRSAPGDESGGDDDHKRKRASTSDRDSQDKSYDFACDECDQVFTRKQSLVLHKKAHSGNREIITCKLCDKQFKIIGAYRTHMEKHSKGVSVGPECSKCHKIFSNNAHLRRHLEEVHGREQQVARCQKCRRTFASVGRLKRHRENFCPGIDSKPRRNDLDGLPGGKDLFKSVAPLTTTYWSDSFSD